MVNVWWLPPSSSFRPLFVPRKIISLFPSQAQKSSRLSPSPAQKILSLLQKKNHSPCGSPLKKNPLLYLYGSPSLYGCVRISKISFKNIFSSQFIWQPYLIEYFLSFWEIYFGNPTFQTDHGTYHFNWPNKRNLLTQWTLFGGSHGHVVFSLPIRHNRLCHFFVFPMRNLVFFWLSVLMDHE